MDSAKIKNFCSLKDKTEGKDKPSWWNILAKDTSDQGLLSTMLNTVRKESGFKHLNRHFTK